MLMLGIRSASSSRAHRVAGISDRAHASVLRIDADHAAQVVVDPDGAEADGESDGKTDDVQPRHEPPGLRVDLIDIPGARNGGPDGAEGHRKTVRLPLAGCGRDLV